MYILSYDVDTVPGNFYYRQVILTEWYWLIF